MNKALNKALAAPAQNGSRVRARRPFGAPGPVAVAHRRPRFNRPLFPLRPRRDKRSASTRAAWRAGLLRKSQAAVIFAYLSRT